MKNTYEEKKAVSNYLLNEFWKEIYDNKNCPKKERLSRLRIELNKLLSDEENNSNFNWFDSIYKNNKEDI